jgi:hypothetical protein
MVVGWYRTTGRGDQSWNPICGCPIDSVNGIVLQNVELQSVELQNVELQKVELQKVKLLNIKLQNVE